MTTGAWHPLTRRWRDIPLRDFTGARCIGMSWLFDSIAIADHREAAKLCAECPVRLACREHLEEVSAAASGVKAGGGPAGTWAGVLVNMSGGRREEAS